MEDELREIDTDPFPQAPNDVKRMRQMFSIKE